MKCPHPARAGRHEQYLRADGSTFCRACGAELERAMPEKTFWNYEETPCTRVRVLVADDIPSGWWCAGMEGTLREAVRVEYGTEKFYLDNENGSAWLKVTKGKGSPEYGHSSLPVASEVLDA